MEKNCGIKIILLVLIHLILASTQDYTLQLDWSITSSAQTLLGYVTWNSQNLISLQRHPNNGEVKHQSRKIDFIQGPNLLGIYFIAIDGFLSIDNVRITKAPSSIDYLINGDFQMCDLGNNPSKTFNNIPGWIGQNIEIEGNGKNNYLLLSKQIRSISQTINFGIVNKYSFINSIDQAIKKQAQDLIASKLQSINLSTSKLRNPAVQAKIDFQNNKAQSIINNPVAASVKNSQAMKNFVNISRNTFSQIMQHITLPIPLPTIANNN